MKKTVKLFSLFMALSMFLGFAGACLAAEPSVALDISGHVSDQGKGVVQHSRAFGGYTGRLSAGMTRSSRQGTLISRDAAIFKVLSVLEDRISDRELLEKVKDKLPALETKRLTLLASLSDRMATSAGEHETNIAFLLLATLIIFS